MNIEYSKEEIMAHFDKLTSYNSEDHGADYPEESYNIIRKALQHFLSLPEIHG